MTNDKMKSLCDIFEHEVKNEKGEVVECRKYYTAKGLSERLPGRRRGGHMCIGTVYELFKQGMPGVTRISGIRLLPVGKLAEVMDWLERRNQQP